MAITITEGLAELRTIDARVEKKRQGIIRHLARPAEFKDPMAAEGGTSEYITKERQSLKDLESRSLNIRVAISRKNLETVLSLHGMERSVAEWLIWRREFAKGQDGFLALQANGIERVRAEAQRKGGSLTAGDAAAKPGDVIVNVSEKELQDEIDKIQHVLGDLDGKLSLINATTTIEV